MTSILDLCAVVAAVGLLGAFGAITSLYRRVHRLEVRTSRTAAQVLDVAREAHHMGASMAARLAEQQRALDSQAAKPRRVRTIKGQAEAPAAPIKQMAVRVAAPDLDLARAEAELTDQDLARERGMDPLGVAIQRKLVSQATRTA